MNSFWQAFVRAIDEYGINIITATGMARTQYILLQSMTLFF